MGNGIEKTFAAFKRTTVKNLPKILTGFGIGGMLAGGIMAVMRTPEAVQRIEDEKKRLGVKKLTLKQMIRVVWRCYIWSLITEGASIACIIAALCENERRNAVLAAAYSLWIEQSKEYRQKVIEKIGENKEEEIRKDIARDHLEKKPFSKDLPPVPDSVPETVVWIRDDYFGNEFMMDVEDVKAAVNKLNWGMNNLTEPYASAADLYYEINQTPPKLSYELGWNTSDGLIEVTFTYKLLPDGHRVGAIMSYVNPPKAGYQECYV